jgi:hypothetical protein
MTSAFLDDIQIDEFDCIVPKEEMFDLYEDEWESLTESDIEDWSSVEY